MTSEIGDEETMDDYYVLFGVLYDDENLYFYFSVSDDILDTTSATWDTDAIEVYIDGDDSKATLYDANDFQITIPYNSPTVDTWVGTGEYPRDGIVYSIVTTDIGWNMEFSIPLDDLEIAGDFGFDLAYNDADATGAREYQAWFLTEGDRWNNPSLWLEATLGAMITSVGDELTGAGDIPTQFNLGQNYPNPFNPVTYIPFSIDKRSTVQLTIYNTLGEKVATLVDGIKEAGSYQVPFNASNLNSGLYYYRLKQESQVLVGKMLLVK
jgi:hypothetical protein